MTRIRTLLVGGFLLPAMVGCAASINIGGGPAGGAPQCPARTAATPDRLDGPLVLTAQSVPTATLLPCLRPLPAGWTFHSMVAKKGRTRVVLDFGRDSDSALTITLLHDCDVRGAVQTASEQRGAHRYDRAEDSSSGYRGERYYVFSGGCVTYRFNLPRATDAEPVATISRTLGFVGRSVLRQYVRDYSNGRLQLDPPQQGSG